MFLQYITKMIEFGHGSLPGEHIPLFGVSAVFVLLSNWNYPSYLTNAVKEIKLCTIHSDFLGKQNLNSPGMYGDNCLLSALCALESRPIEEMQMTQA